MHLQVDGFVLDVTELGEGELVVTTDLSQTTVLLAMARKSPISVLVKQPDLYIGVQAGADYDFERAVNRKRELRIVLDVLEDVFQKIDPVNQEASAKIRELVLIFKSFLNN